MPIQKAVHYIRFSQRSLQKLCSLCGEESEVNRQER